MTQSSDDTSEYFPDSSPYVTVPADFNIWIKAIASIRYAVEISEQALRKAWRAGDILLQQRHQGAFNCFSESSIWVR